MKVTQALILVGILLTISSTQTTYVSDFNTLFRHGANIQYPLYNIGYRLNGTTIQLNFTTPNTVEDFDVGDDFNLVVEDIDDNAVTCTTVTGCGNGDFECVQSCPIIKSAIYRFYVWKSGGFPTNENGNSPEKMAYFQMEVTSFLTSSGGSSNSSAVITELFKAT